MFWKIVIEMATFLIRKRFATLRYIYLHTEFINTANQHHHSNLLLAALEALFSWRHAVISNQFLADSVKVRLKQGWGTSGPQHQFIRPAKANTDFSISINFFHSNINVQQVNNTNTILIIEVPCMSLRIYVSPCCLLQNLSNYKHLVYRPQTVDYGDSRNSSASGKCVAS